MIIRRKKSLVAGAALAAATLLVAAPANAVSYRLDFSEARPDDGDVAADSRVSAVFADVPSGVAMTLRMQPGSAGSWKNEHLQHLWLNYAGNVSGLSMADIPRGVNRVEFGENAFQAQRFGDYDIHMSFNSSGWNNGQYRLDGGEELRLVFLNASARDFHALSESGRAGTYYGLVKVVNPGAGNSIQMGATDVAPIPLPAGLLLFGPAVAGLFAFGIRRRHNRNTAPG